MTERGLATEEYLERIEEMLDTAMKIPLSGGKCVVDAAEIQEILADIRSHLPGEIRQAQALVADRAKIIATAKREAEDIVAQGEARARQLVSQEEVVAQAQARAGEILSQAQAQARSMRKAAFEFSDAMLRRVDESLSAQLGEVRRVRTTLRTAPQNNEQPEDI